RRWREGLTPGAAVLLVGAGLIGCEFADDLAALGYPVTVVDPSPWPLGRLLPAELGGELRLALEARGVRFHLGRTLARVEPGAAYLDDGTVVPFARALAAMGLEARTTLAAEAGLETGRGGIVVDRTLRTRDPDIFALGDCAMSPAGPLPFVQPLLAQAKVLAATLTGQPTPLTLPALPVQVKTTSLPVVACPPPFGVNGTWQVEGQGADRTAVMLGGDGKAVGFALTGAHAPRHRELAATMPDLLPAV
ncbi:MAG TPA: FAD-dependent oxidoreductase, partial [Azospirillaceae bacterium]|nr:FAD-dependent oxidoreductase [Azospirillaceae bacterium]